MEQLLEKVRPIVYTLTEVRSSYVFVFRGEGKKECNSSLLHIDNDCR